MTLVYHPQVQVDVNGILLWYRDKPDGLEEAFWEELQLNLMEVAANPRRYHLIRVVIGDVTNRLAERLRELGVDPDNIN